MDLSLFTLFVTGLVLYDRPDARASQLGGMIIAGSLITSVRMEK